MKETYRILLRERMQEDAAAAAGGGGVHGRVLD